MMRGFCPRGFCPERAYVLMELCMEGVLSEGALSGGGFVLPSVFITCLFVKLRQKVHNKMPMLPSEETMLVTARILCDSST